MGFILDGLETEAYDRTYRDRDLLTRILDYFRPYTGKMVLVAVAITLNSMAGTAGPILIAKGIDLLRVEKSPSATTILLLSIGVLLLGVFAWAFNFIQQWFSARVIGSVVLQLRKDVFDATIRHDLSFFEEHPSGKIVSRVTSDTQDFSDVVSLVTNLISQVLLVLILSVWLFSINTGLTLLLLAMSPFAIFIALSFRRIARLVTQRARRVTAKINAQIQESVSGIMVAKTFRQERAIYETFDENNQQAYAVGWRRGLTLNSIFPVMGVVSGLGIAALMFFGGLSASSGAISPGSWYLFMEAVGFYWFPMLNIASFWSQFQDGLAAAERVFALIDLEPQVVQTASEPVGTASEPVGTASEPVGTASEPVGTASEPAGLATGPAMQGRIEFCHLKFTYTGDEIVLPDFSLEIRPKETLALVGHTGAGKSSIVNLIARFYEFQDGQLLINGRDIRRLDLSQYRRHIGLVPQDPFLFSGSVRDNIRYGRPEASDEQVREAAMHISQGEWLANLSNGLDTDVGERGLNLSMGQRQLVALARVLIQDPAILILDEATASVDPFTETQIQEGLEAILRDRTAIIVAHRLSTIKRADRIIVMDHGQIIGEGTHDQLMAQGGHYAELYNAYFRHQSLEYIENFVAKEEGD